MSKQPTQESNTTNNSGIYYLASFFNPWAYGTQKTKDAPTTSTTTASNLLPLPALYQFTIEIAQSKRTLREKKAVFLRNIKDYIQKLDVDDLAMLFQELQIDRRRTAADQKYAFIYLEDTTLFIGGVKKLMGNSRPTGNTQTYKIFVGHLKAHANKISEENKEKWRFRGFFEHSSDEQKLTALIGAQRGRLASRTAWLGYGQEGEFRENNDLNSCPF